MRELKENIKKYFLIKYTESKLNKYNKKLTKSLSWIQKQSLTNTIETHCNVVLTNLIDLSKKHSYRTNKFIIDSIFKYTLERSENLIKSNKKTRNVKNYMQLNSYIVYDEIIKGLAAHKNKNTIKYNIEKQLSDVQEKIKSNINIDEILQETINA